ncbi:MAG TPA: glycosyltransferase [Patescibacteria group bacterium]|nr:glycosyltransferase [Patescibacteria group bacterium]
MKVALVYDRVNKWGGAERLIVALKKMFPEAPLYTSVYDKKKANWASIFKIETSFLQQIPLASSSHEFYATLMPIAFESFSFDQYDLVISVTSEAAKGIITKPGTTHICFCLTPTRYLWSGYETYFKNPYLKFFAGPVISYLRFWDKIASKRPDELIAISNEVKKRIKKYYKRDSEVIYPPITLLSDNANVSQGEYFLVVSRLVPYKRIDLAIKACKELKLPLKIIGSGSQKQYLKKISSKNIEFLGHLTDKELIYYYKNCKGLIFPGVEDFGLSMVEAQAFGKPVIAQRAGGALEIVKEGITGEFFDNPTVESLREVLINFNVSRYNSENCQKNARNFSFKEFEQKFTEFLKSRLDKNL